MSEHDDETKRGDIEMVGKDLGVPPTPFDRIAVGGRGELLMVSLVGETQRVKQIRAILAGGARVTIQAGSEVVPVRYRQADGPALRMASDLAEDHPLLEVEERRASRTRCGIVVDVGLVLNSGSTPLLRSRSLDAYFEDPPESIPLPDSRAR